jgi:hypothetical protein
MGSAHDDEEIRSAPVSSEWGGLPRELRLAVDIGQQSFFEVSLGRDLVSSSDRFSDDANVPYGRRCTNVGEG